ncbi:hypothetical protein [uncultured Dokdonia sp.]|uniref:hypothetical protein n=1 Tax=uncultured Dokdonia sp. TaxID=575653 RepID=UPI00261258E8|nr:hypothetical protein [uncultured Dokdonia sp.]
MKYYIKLIVLFITLFPSTQESNSQTIEKTDQQTTTVTIEIPQQLKSDQVLTKSNESSFKKYSEYNKKVNGHVTILLDTEGKVVKITAPKSVSSNILLNQESKIGIPCPQCLNKDGYDEACVLVCIFEAIFGTK